MHKNKINLKATYIFLLFFLAFGGYYAALIIFSNVLIATESRNITVSIRIGIVLFLFFIFMMRPKLKIQKSLIYFIIFSLAYLLRIFFEYLDPNSTFHIPDLEFLLYFISFVLFPLFLLSQLSLNQKDYKTAFWGLLLGIFFLSLLTFFFYKDLIGNVARISLAIKRGDGYISPLALSYSSALGIGTGLSYLLTNKIGFLKKIAVLATVGFSFIPFFLGNSRGSLLALSSPFLFYFFYVKGTNKKANLLFAITFLIFMFVFFTKYLRQNVFERFANTYNAIITEGSSAARIEIWRAGLVQFTENPLFGDSLNCTHVNSYPHNILIEVMITTGIVGLVPFVLFLYQVLKKIKIIIRFFPEYFWVCVIFIQAFTQNMFSGSIYAAGWLALGAGLVLSIDLNSKIKKNNRFQIHP